MPPYPGEERLVTVFADIHYYFAQPTRRPLLHRFDKASYFYIYYNSTRHTSRIEVANNPGTSDQDAFNGYIDTCRIINSYRFPTLLTIEVDGVPTSPSSPKSGRDPEEWRLASADPRDPNRTKYKLHTLDIYFWASEDARLVIECFKKLLPSNQLDVAELDPEPEREPHQEPARSSEKPANTMSPVVQNLENLAITDAYNGQQKAQHTASPTSSFISHNIPPPPPPGGPSGQQLHSPSPAISDLSSQYDTQHAVQSKPQSADFTPMAYNPAAPAAPEPIAFREKTPPPPDAGDGTGLVQAAKHDQGYIPGPPPQQQQQQQQQGGYQIGQGPPVTFGGGYASPPPQQPGYGSPTQSQPTAYGSPPQSSYSQQDPRSSMTSTAPSFGPGAPSTLGSGPRHSTAAETYVPQRPAQPTQTPSNQFYDSLQQTRSDKPLSHVQPQYADYLSQTSPPQQQSSPQPPPGGYSQYQYGSSGQQTQPLSHNPYDIHHQVYRPTEAEANPHHHKKPSKSSTGEKKDSRFEKAEKGVGRLFKRIEKKIG